MRRLFAEHGFSAGTCLPAGKIRLMCDAAAPAPNPEKMKAVIGLAERELEAELPPCPASLYLRYVTDGDRAAYEAAYFRRREAVLRLSLAETYEGKGRFTMKLADAIWAIMEESGWALPAHLASCSPSHGDLGLPAVFGEGRMHAVDLFSAATAALLSMVYLLNKTALDALSPVIPEKLKYTVTDRLLKPFAACDFWWTGMNGNKVNNWNPWIVSNLLFAAAVTAEDDRTLREIVQKAAAVIDNYTASLPEDGGCDEGPSYWTVAGAAYFDALELIYDITGGKFDIFGDPFVKAICEYEPKMQIHGSYFINFADCAPRVRPDGALLLRMGRKCGSDALLALGRTADRGAALSADCVYRTLRGLCTPAPETDGARACLRAWLPALKIMTARENEDTGKGLFAAMKGGHNGESHNHNDLGSVIVYCDGAPVLIDPGRGTYSRQTFSERRYELWYTQSGYHNTAVIGGKEQPPGAQYRSADEVYDPVTGALKLELKNAYPPAAGICSYTRETVLTDGGVRITDAFILDGEKEIELRFMTCEKPEPQNGSTLRLARGLTMRVDPRLTAVTEEFPVEDGTIQRAWGTPVLWRIRLCGKTRAAAFVTVIGRTDGGTVS